VSFSSTFDGLSVPLVFWNVRDDAMIPQHLSCSPSIKGTIRIEEGSFDVEPTALHVFEELLELCFKLKCIIMLTSKNVCCGNDIPFGICYWEDIAGLRFLSTLIADFFAPFFAALWLPSRLSSDKFNSPLMVMILASNSRCMLPSRLHLRK
jgi:hypothetical protein